MRHLLVSKKTAERLAGSRTLIPKNPRMRHRAPPDAVRKWTHRPLAVERRTVNSHREAIEDPVRRTERVDKKRGEIEGRLVVKAVDSREETLADKLVDSREETLADQLVDKAEKVVWTDHRRIDIPGPLEPIAKKNDRRTEPLTDCISSSCRPRF